MSRGAAPLPPKGPPMTTKTTAAIPAPAWSEIARR